MIQKVCPTPAKVSPTQNLLRFGHQKGKIWVCPTPFIGDNKSILQDMLAVLLL